MLAGQYPHPELVIYVALAQVADGATVVLIYLVVLWLPGLALGYTLRARGWTLVGVAPLVTYGVAGVAGPLVALVDIPWSATTFAIGTLAMVIVAAGARLRRDGAAAVSAWTPSAHVGVATVLVLAAAVGAVAIALPMQGLDTVPQDWDAVFHANGVRWIADTGDGGLFAMSQVNWFESGTQLFYPNGYHLLAAVAYQLSGAGVPAVLNAHTLLIPGLAALSIVVLVRRMGGRAVLAACSAAVVVSLSALYDMLWRGPLLPYATGVVLTPLIVVLLLNLIDAVDIRSMVRPGLLFAVGMAGLVCLQPAAVLGAILFAAPPLVQRWWSRPRLVGRDALVILVTGAGAAGLSSMQLVAGFATAGGLDSQDWPADLTRSEALVQLLTFSHAAERPQMWIIAACVAGLLTYRRLGALRWIGAVAALFGLLFLVAASSDAAWANSITSFWWNDRWRLIAPAAIAMAVVAGHGLAETQRWIVATAGRWSGRSARAGTRPRNDLAIRAAVAVGVLLVFAAATEGLYVGRNAARMAVGFSAGPALTADEIAGIRVLAELAGPGARVLNDRGDGSAWMYALTGLLPVAGHYNGSLVGPDTTMLENRFNTYLVDPAVRAAVERLGIKYVILSDTFLRPWAVRQPGLVGLDTAPWLEQVHQNSDVTIYRIRPDAMRSRGVDG